MKTSQTKSKKMQTYNQTERNILYFILASWQLRLLKCAPIVSHLVFDFFHLIFTAVLVYVCYVVFAIIITDFK